MNWTPELLESSIDEYIDKNIPTVKVDDKATAAVQKLDNNAFGVVLVIDADNLLKGIITKSDLTKLVQSPKPKTAMELGTMEKVVAISDQAQLWQMLKIMNGDNKVHMHLDALPVVNAQKKPVGVIRRETIRLKLPKKITKPF